MWNISEIKHDNVKGRLRKVRFVEFLHRERILRKVSIKCSSSLPQQIWSSCYVITCYVSPKYVHLSTCNLHKPTQEPTYMALLYNSLPQPFGTCMPLSKVTLFGTNLKTVHQFYVKLKPNGCSSLKYFKPSFFRFNFSRKNGKTVLQYLG